MANTWPTFDPIISTFDPFRQFVTFFSCDVIEVWSRKQAEQKKIMRTMSTCCLVHSRQTATIRPTSHRNTDSAGSSHRNTVWFRENLSFFLYLNCILGFLSIFSLPASDTRFKIPENRIQNFRLGSWDHELFELIVNFDNTSGLEGFKSV